MLALWQVGTPIEMLIGMSHTVEASSELRPAGHWRHTPGPSLFLNHPTGHGEHVNPFSSYPAMQEQFPAPGGEVENAGHGAHVLPLA